jgi:hypothetical protein
MSTIQAIAFRRNQLRRVRDAFPEIERPGVYILIGADEAEPDRLLAYIGESEGVGARLAYHNANEQGRDAKAFWTDTAVLISKDENLTKSHARYLEACLVRAAGGSPRWSLPNAKRPSDDAGKLPLPDRAAMEEFVDQTTTLVGALGWDLFRRTRGTISETSGARHHALQSEEKLSEGPLFLVRGEGYAAEMRVGTSGDFIVLAGSKARTRTTPTIPRGANALRTSLLEKDVLQRDGDSLRFASDYSFSSASAAATIVLGASVNGRNLWKLADGRTYAEWEASQGTTSTLPSPQSTAASG